MQKRERERERDRQTDTQAGRQVDKLSGRQTDRQTDRDRRVGESLRGELQLTQAALTEPRASPDQSC